MGLVGGFYGGRVDDVISFTRQHDTGVSGVGVVDFNYRRIGTIGASIVVAITFASSPAVFRIVRGEVLTIRNRDFIAAAKTRGESVAYILFAEILPNAKAPLIVDACLRMGYTSILIGILVFSVLACRRRHRIGAAW